MRDILKGAAIAAAFLGGPLAAEAQDNAPVQTARTPSVDAQLRAQQQQIEQQNARIQQLEDQLRELTSVMTTRVDRVEAHTDTGRVAGANPGMRLEGPSGRHSMNFIGAVQVTAGAVDQSDRGAGAPVIHGGTDIRRARIGIQGTAYNDFAYQAEIDLAATTGSVSNAARDVWVAYNGLRPWSFTAGNIKPQTGLETSSSDRSNAGTFIESSTLAQLITTTGARNIGFRASTGGAHWSTNIGYYGDDLNNNGLAATANEGAGWHGRVTWAPFVSADRHLLHFGVSGFRRDVQTTTGTAGSNGVLRPRAQPEYAVDTTRLVDTGNLAFADTVSLLGLEAAGFIGPVGFQSEWAQMDVSQNLARPDLEFSGAYVNANWFLTGESRNYDPRTGVFTRMSPKANVDPSSGTWGAWELAGRWSTIDLNSAENVFSGATLLGARGGEETNYTLGLNWYWNPYLRLMLNATRADVDNFGNALVSPANESTELNLYSLRVQQEW